MADSKLRRGSLINYKASPERQNAFAQMMGDDLVIAPVLPRKDKRPRPRRDKA